ncbi:MAG TPA: helicase HerA-like domain-containing protein [Bacteroidota bacterium]|nr:helicase HerA-like domain-containing protein [Bacteroidota bacterium]
MSSAEKHIGVVYSISTLTALAFLDDSLTKMERTINGKTYIIGQIGAFVSIPVGATTVIGMIGKVRLAESAGGQVPPAAEMAKARKEMEIQLIGSVVKGRFEKGVANFPPVGADVFMTDDSDMTTLFSAYAQFGFAIGDISGYMGERQYIDPNKFFGKHVALLGSTGSGKSTAVSSILQKVQMFTNTHVIILDIHDEYKAAFRDFGNIINITDLELPHWFMNFEEMREAFVDESEPSAQSQEMLLKDLVLNAKKVKNPTLQEFITIDAPVYYDLNEVRAKFQFYDTERITGYGGGQSREGPFFGQFTRFLVRLDSRMTDKRYEFMFKPKKFKDSNAIKDVISKIFGLEAKKQITVLDLSGVPFDIVNVIVSLLARMVFDFNFWNKSKSDFPVLLVFEEAHNYLPQLATEHNHAARRTVERIAKEGRKYGVGCMIVSQRPSELSETILSQCNNFITLRLTNPTDQNYVKKLVPDSFSGLFDILPTLRPGEALIIGDSTPLPVRVLLDYPAPPPDSADIKFYDKWVASEKQTVVSDVVDRWWKQDRS